jgi:hypothetical protein
LEELEVPPRPEVLIAELDDIDRQALDLAVTVAQHPALRFGLGAGVKLLKKRLLEIAEELKNTDPATYEGRSDQISESILDLNFVETDSDITSLRLAQSIEAETLGSQKVHDKYDKPFPLPDKVQNFTQTLISDMISFQTTLSLEDIASFYRHAFAQWGLSERKLFADYCSNEFINLIFEGLPDQRIIAVGAIDLGYSSDQDLRNVNLHTEEDPWT